MANVVAQRCMMLAMPDGQDALSHDDRLSLEVGRVARAGVQLESALRGAFLQLCGFASPAAALLDTTWRVPELIGGIRRMSTRIAWGEVGVTAVEAAMKAADEANTARNRVVHDMWMPRTDETGTPTGEWTRLRTGKADKKMRWAGYAGMGLPDTAHIDAADVVLQLQAAAARAGVIGFAAWPWMPPMSESSAVEDGLRDLRFIAGPIEPFPGQPGGWRLIGE